MKCSGIQVTFQALLILQISGIQRSSQTVTPVDEIPLMSSKNASRPLVHTGVGSIRGLWANDGTYSMFMGIPYAKVDPDNVFGPAIPQPIFEEVFNAFDDSALCPQIEMFNFTIAGTLDCLHLNIYVPNIASTENLKPVMVYIFGGNFTFGFPSRLIYGPSFIVRHDVILVTLNYRLGPYGFMCLDTPEVPGNQGLKDQVKALRWIKENIIAFGGDDTRVTLVGNSAGAMSADFHWYFNEEPLFRRLILQSGVALVSSVITSSIPTAPFKLAELLNYTTSDYKDALSFLSSVDPHQLIGAANASGLDFRPCIEKQFLNVDNFITRHPINVKTRRVHNVDILMGFTDDECNAKVTTWSKNEFDKYDHVRDVIDGYFDFKSENKVYDDVIEIVKHFYLGDAEQSADNIRPVADLLSNFVYQNPMLRTVQKYLDSDIENLYFYLFSYTGGRRFFLKGSTHNVTTGGASHCDELGYLFDISYMKKPLHAEDKLIMERITELWTNFIKYGNPTPRPTDLIPLQWPRVTRKKLYYLQIDTELQVDTRPLRERMCFVDLIYRMNGQYQIGFEPSSANNHFFMESSLMPTAWIYQLKKEQLIEEAAERGIATEGQTVEQIRKLIVASTKETEQFQTPNRKEVATMSDTEQEKKSSKISRLVKEWNITFRVTDSAVEFLERLSELIEASEASWDEVLLLLPRILQGKALLWYRNNVASWETWEDFLELFKLYFFPPNYEEDLIVDIVARKQKYREKFFEYVTDLQTLMRRYGKLSEAEMLHRIHENMLREYKLYIQKQDYKNLAGLLKLASEYEGITAPRSAPQSWSWQQDETESYTEAGRDWQPQTNEYNQPGTSRTAPQSTGNRDVFARTKAAQFEKIHPKYDSRTCCWSCGKPGHDTRSCRGGKKLFCSTCGKLGVLTRNCCKKEAWGKRELLGSANEQYREDNRTFIEVTIMGEQYKGLVDTGSTNTYISESVYTKCLENGAVTADKPRGVTLADGSTSQIVKGALVDLEAKQARIKHWVRVLPTASGIILGMDVLRRIGMQIGWNGEGQDSTPTPTGKHENQVTTPTFKSEPAQSTQIGTDLNKKAIEEARNAPCEELRRALPQALEQCLSPEPIYYINSSAPERNKNNKCRKKYRTDKLNRTSRKRSTERLQKSIKYTPAFLLCGRELRQPGVRNDFPTPQREKIKKLNKTYASVREQQNKASENQKSHYDKQKGQWSPELGDLVLTRNHVLSDANKNFCSKLAPKYKGPFQITQRKSPVIYLLQATTGNKPIITAHVKDLKPYKQ